MVERAGRPAAQGPHCATDGSSSDAFLSEAHQVCQKAVFAPHPRFDHAGRGDGGARVRDGVGSGEPHGSLEDPGIRIIADEGFFFFLFFLEKELVFRVEI